MTKTMTPDETLKFIMSPAHPSKEKDYMILDSKHNLVPADIMAWANFFEKPARIVGKTKFNGFLISTVFLGIDHGFGGKPLWFETMIFKGDSDSLYCYRYETWDEAVKGHKKAVEMVKKGEIKDGDA